AARDLRARGHVRHVPSAEALAVRARAGRRRLLALLVRERGARGRGGRRDGSRAHLAPVGVVGFGALHGGGLAWCDGGEGVELDGLGDVFAAPTLNPLLALGPAGWREAVAAARAHDGPRGGARDARTRLPFDVGDYVDFNSSREHATNLGRFFRP